MFSNVEPVLKFQNNAFGTVSRSDVMLKRSINEKVKSISRLLDENWLLTGVKSDFFFDLAPKIFSMNFVN